LLLQQLLLMLLLLRPLLSRLLLLLTGQDASTDGHIASEGALLVNVVACTQQQPARRPNTHDSTLSYTNRKQATGHVQQQVTS
jgi:hypothetical protein